MTMARTNENTVSSAVVLVARRKSGRLSRTTFICRRSPDGGVRLAGGRRGGGGRGGRAGGVAVDRRRGRRVQADLAQGGGEGRRPLAALVDGVKAVVDEGAEGVVALLQA